LVEVSGCVCEISESYRPTPSSAARPRRFCPLSQTHAGGDSFCEHGCWGPLERLVGPGRSAHPIIRESPTIARENESSAAPPPISDSALCASVAERTAQPSPWLNNSPPSGSDGRGACAPTLTARTNTLACRGPVKPRNWLADPNCSTWRSQLRIQCAIGQSAAG
jgi:hypothetical protein